MKLRYLFLFSFLPSVTAPVSNAAFTFLFSEIGNDVVAIGSGTLNISSLNFTVLDSSTVNLIPEQGNFRSGDVGVAWSFSDSFSAVGPGSFGNITQSNFIHHQNTSVGDYVGVTAFNGRIFAPGGYVSGAPLSNTSVWNNATFTSLGLVEGSYVYTWGSGPTADSLTVRVANVPEPSPLMLSLVGLAAGSLGMRRRTKVA